MVSSEGLSGSPAPAAKQYGVTKPLSVAGPTEADRQRSRELEKVCIHIIVFQESFFFFFDIEVLMLKFWFLG
jgi:poly(A) polymerase